MSLTLRTAYWDDPKARSSFKKFMLAIHGLDLSEWEARGYWDHAYTPFSFFSGDKIVSSVCIYLLDAIVNGEPTRLAQISGVGTLPEWRRRSLNRQLTEAGLEWARERQTGVFLFADTDAVPFYEKCGFRPIEECIESVTVRRAARRDGAVKLDCGNTNDLDKIYRQAMGRAPISNRLSVLNEKLLMFHALHQLRDCVYEIPPLDCLVFTSREEGRLRIFDIVGERVPSLGEIYPYIAAEGDTTIEFHFHADKLGVGAVETAPLFGNHCHVRGRFPVDRPVFPFTSRA